MLKRNDGDSLKGGAAGGARVGVRARVCGVARRFGREERGTQLAELAIVLPVLMLMFVATAEFGRFFYTYTTLAKATRLGARYLSAKAVGGTEVANAKRIVVYGDLGDGAQTPLLSGLGTANVDVAYSGGTATVPQTVTVRITGYRYQPLFNLGGALGDRLSLNIDVQPSTTMRYLLTQPPV